MKLHRLFSMDTAELAFRGRQQTCRTLEWLTVSASPHAPRCRLDTRQCAWPIRKLLARLKNGEEEGADVLLQHQLQQRMSARFFAGASDKLLDRYLPAAGDNVAAQQLVASAEAICQGEFEILGYGRLSFGRPVNWRFDPVSGRESPMVHWSRINALAPDQVGDSKVVWELNRHQWLLDLGQAFRLTHDERYAECFARLITDWMRHNPPGMGINWSSALEAAMRLISWCWALFLFRGSQALTAELFHSMLGWIQYHARFVERNLSRYYSPNTHLTAEALGLYYAGSLLPELQGAERWRAVGSRILIEQVNDQIHADGVYFEQSTRYQYYTAEIYLHFVILADRNHTVLPEVVGKRLQQMLEFLLYVRRPDGTIPQLGDADGGWLLPLLRREPGDYRGLFSTAAVVFNNSHFALAAGGLAAESLWLLGAGAKDRWPSLSASPPPLKPLQIFQEGGYVVMRNSGDARGHQLIFDTGPLGCRVSGGHGHADLLSVQCSAWGESYLVDAGTCCYTSDAKWRDYFRGTGAHNTLLVDGRGQAEPNGPFSWCSRPAARLRNCVSMPGYMMADADHDAYSRRDDPITHRRRVMFIRSSYWLIVDDVIGDANHNIELRYQFAPLPVATEVDGWVRAQGASSALLLKVFSTSNLSSHLGQGELEPPLGWISPNYGQRRPAPALTFTTAARLPLRLVTVIFPLEEPDAQAPPVSPMFEQGTIAGLVFAAGKPEVIRI